MGVVTAMDAALGRWDRIVPVPSCDRDGRVVTYRGHGITADVSDTVSQFFPYTTNLIVEQISSGSGI